MQSVNPALESEYNNRALVPEHPAIFERWRRDSANFRENTRCTPDLAYGPEPLHTLDLFQYYMNLCIARYHEWGALQFVCGVIVVSAERVAVWLRTRTTSHRWSGSNRAVTLSGVR